MNINDQFLSTCVGEVPENLRDEFAKIVLAGVTTPSLVGEVVHGYVAAEAIAKSIYLIADALMKERVESRATVKIDSEIMAAMTRSKP